MNNLPKLSPRDTISQSSQAFLTAIDHSDFSGDIDFSYGSRMTVATDNSIYQQIPQAVLHPKTVHDLQLIGSIAAQHPDVTFSARGGGTGTNGQSLTPGIVVDTSRYMSNILELNLTELWVRVESGVVKDELNDFLRPHGYFFSPDLSTSNRATIGGMISTDASGQGSLVYGKTSDHLLGLKTVLANGELLDTCAIEIKDAEAKAKQSSTEGKIYKQVLASCVNKRDAIIKKFPRLNRFLTGYDLEHAYDHADNKIDVGRLVAGAEGSLAFIAEAKLNITKIPNHSTLLNIKYDKFESALRHAPSMIEADATSVETVDSKVLNLARADIVWHSVSDLISDVDNKTMDGLNMVEYNSDDLTEIEEKVGNLCACLDKQIANGECGVIGYQLTSNTDDIKKIYAMRKKAVGLLGKTKGDKKPIAFTEDTAVPPENLADFIMEFRELLDSHGLQYGMFGHVDAGVLHVRPALDLCDPEQEKLVNTISAQVVDLVARYGGLMWGEHGKGYRSEFAEAFFGDELYKELRKIKNAFDPHNQMNPGKICTPIGSSDELVKVSDTKRASFDRQIPISFKQEFEPAMSCNGNGLCFNYDTRSPMCPSSKITRDRRHSPKGRASLIREWLYQLSKHDLAEQNISPSLFSSSFLSKLKRGFDKDNKSDFNHEVFEAMDGCLACKSCSSQCPVGVDVPDFRAKFLSIYYSRYQRPIKDYFVANVERLTPLMAKAPKLMNTLVQSSPVEWALKKTLGYVDTPALSVPSLKNRVVGKSLVLDSEAALETLIRMNDTERAKYVLIVQDPFTSFYDAELVDKLVDFISKIGKTAVILPFSPNGKPQHVKGFLKEFEATVHSTSELLIKIAKLGMPMLGADASLVLCYRDEYKKVIGVKAESFSVLTISEWLEKHVINANLMNSHTGSNKNSSQSDIKVSLKENDEVVEKKSFKLLAHCSEKTAIPNTEKVWQGIFASLGMELEIASVGCCGMAGTYGHELSHYEDSKGIYNLSWSHHTQADDDKEILATGYSCRSQVKRFEGVRPKHPIEVLADHI